MNFDFNINDLPYYMAAAVCFISCFDAVRATGIIRIKKQDWLIREILTTCLPMAEIVFRHALAVCMLGLILIITLAIVTYYGITIFHILFIPVLSVTKAHFLIKLNKDVEYMLKYKDELLEEIEH